MSLGLRLDDIRHPTPVVVPSNSLAVVIGLDLSLRASIAKVVSREFPVNLVEVIGNQDGATNHASSRCSLHDYVHLSKQDVEVGPQLRGVVSFVEDKFCAMTAIPDRGIIRYSPVGW